LARRTLCRSGGRTARNQSLPPTDRGSNHRCLTGAGFAIVEEYGNAEDARVAGYGLAYADRSEVDAVEGGFRLSSESAESARTLFEITSGDQAVRRVHLVWLS
jgi:hypothetical protein